MVDSGIPTVVWEIKLKNVKHLRGQARVGCVPVPVPWRHKYIHTQQEARLDPGRSVILLYFFIHVVPSLWTSGIGCKKLASPKIISIRDP